MVLEICAYSLEGCRTAVASGAHRIELCAGAPQWGGLTPDLSVVRAAMSMGVPVFPMVRPRAGDFNYSALEWTQIREDLRRFKEAGCPGAVCGISNGAGMLDSERMHRLAEEAGAMELTCHKVFDTVLDRSAALELLVEMGFCRVLTSGGAPTVLQGLSELRSLVAQANGRIRVMPGGGVRSGNVIEVLRTSTAEEVHSAACTDHGDVDAEEVRRMRRSMDQWAR